MNFRQFVEQDIQRDVRGGGGGGGGRQPIEKSDSKAMKMCVGKFGQLTLRIRPGILPRGDADMPFIYAEIFFTVVRRFI